MKGWESNKVIKLGLIFFFLLGIIQKYVSVLQRYFVQYLGGFDVAVLKEVVQVCFTDLSLN